MGLHHNSKKNLGWKGPLEDVCCNLQLTTKPMLTLISAFLSPNSSLTGQAATPSHLALQCHLLPPLCPSGDTRARAACRTQGNSTAQLQELQNKGTGELTHGRAQTDNSVKQRTLFQEKGCSTALGSHRPDCYHRRNPHHKFKIRVSAAYTQGQYLIIFQMVTMKLLGCFQDKQFVGFFNHLRKTGTRVEGASAPIAEQCWKTLCFWETAFS